MYALKGYFCERCGDNRKGFLNVHHKHYRTLGNENINRDLAVLCRNCHAEYHSIFGSEPDEFTFNKFVRWKLKQKHKKQQISPELRALRKQSRKYKQSAKDYRKFEKLQFNLSKAKELLGGA